jgi:pimeloyl-ACP methyl ester carboxylesterase
MDGTLVYDWVSEACFRTMRQEMGATMAENGGATTSAKAETDLTAAVVRFLTPRPAPPTPRDLEMIDQGSPVVLDCGLAATAWGEGPTVLLAHGWESRRTHWSAFVPALTAAGYRAVAIDAPAHGDSPGETSNMHAECSMSGVSSGRWKGSSAIPSAQGRRRWPWHRGWKRGGPF